jgi:talin
VRRWVAGPNSFTLDFGGYADYYSSQTEEGETISQLIAGYIDIILKKKQEQDQRSAVVTSEAVMAEVSQSCYGRGTPPGLFPFLLLGWDGQRPG